MWADVRRSRGRLSTRDLDAVFIPAGGVRQTAVAEREGLGALADRGRNSVLASPHLTWWAPSHAPPVWAIPAEAPSGPEVTETLTTSNLRSNYAPAPHIVQM